MPRVSDIVKPNITPYLLESGDSPQWVCTGSEAEELTETDTSETQRSCLKPGDVCGFSHNARECGLNSVTAHQVIHFEHKQSPKPCITYLEFNFSTEILTATVK